MRIAEGQNVQQIARRMARRLRETMGAEQVWLFGSQGRGDADADSDIDLLAVVPDSNESRYRRAVAARRQLAGFKLPLDVVVLTRQEWEKELAAPCSLSRTVRREGIALGDEP